MELIATNYRNLWKFQSLIIYIYTYIYILLIKNNNR